MGAHGLGLKSVHCGIFFTSEQAVQPRPLVALNSAFHGAGNPSLPLEVPSSPLICFLQTLASPHTSAQSSFPTQAHGESDSGLIRVSEPETTSSLLPSGKSTGPGEMMSGSGNALACVSFLSLVQLTGFQKPGAKCPAA